MSEEYDDTIPEGAAVFPEIPEGLGIHPLLSAVMHATVFLSGSDSTVVNPAAADEALDWMVRYLEQLDGARLKQVQEDITCLLKYAKDEKWPKQLIEAIKSFRQLYESEE